MRELDSLDIKILDELCADGRLSNIQLAEKVGLSPSPCWQRVRRLEREGLIMGYSALVDQKKMGYSETVLVEITLERHQGYQLEDVCKELATFPEVLEVHLTSGEFDCFLKVACNGTSGYEEFLKKKLYAVAGIRHSRSVFTLRCFKNTQHVSQR
ncbi:Lrp/AsnC family transcriptional regulator [Sneathiella sp.]|uniref:Lrp/AsnC family transcriptional regulator n=1 Tax=Sneathiella sp. TaxID=1964365 RepID=UPI003568E7C9